MIECERHVLDCRDVTLLRVVTHNEMVDLEQRNPVFAQSCSVLRLALAQAWVDYFVHCPTDQEEGGRQKAHGQTRRHQ